MESLDVIKQKILTRKDLKQQLAVWRFKEKTIVFSNGCFDILHLGHIEYLSKAADLGEVLIIGLNSDHSVKKIKGEGRPVNHEISRAILLASLGFVSAVVLFEEDTPVELIRLIQPDILVKGADYRIEEIAGSDIVMSKGGQIITIPLTEGYSTTSLIERICN